MPEVATPKQAEREFENDSHHERSGRTTTCTGLVESSTAMRVSSVLAECSSTSCRKPVFGCWGGS